MKTLRIVGFSLFTLIVFYSCKSDQKSGNIASDIIGAYEYTGDLEGFALYDANHFAFTFRTKSDKPDSLLTLEEKYNSINSNAGTWTVTDSIVTCTLTFHKDPELIGTSFRFVYDLKGNLHNYRLIDQNGKTIGSGSAIKIK